MFKREMKINFKSFVIWTAILIGLFLVVFLRSEERRVGKECL